MSVLVVIPTLHRPKMCTRALDSLFEQNFAGWECVIAKNGGTEALGSYVAALGPRLNHPRVKMLVLPESGLAYALNEAVSRFLDGHYAFANLEDDDEWDPEFLRKMFKCLRTDGVDVVHCKQRQRPRQMQSDGAPMDPNTMRKRNYINFPMCLFKADLFEKVGGFTPEAGPATDWDWHLKCTGAGAKYGFVPHILVTHYWHGENWCLQETDNAYVRQRIEEGVYDK